MINKQTVISAFDNNQSLYTNGDDIKICKNKNQPKGYKKVNSLDILKCLNKELGSNLTKPDIEKIKKVVIQIKDSKGGRFRAIYAKILGIFGIETSFHLSQTILKTLEKIPETAPIKENNRIVSAPPVSAPAMRDPGKSTPTITKSTDKMPLTSAKEVEDSETVKKLRLNEPLSISLGAYMIDTSGKRADITEMVGKMQIFFKESGVQIECTMTEGGKGALFTFRGEEHELQAAFNSAAAKCNIPLSNSNTITVVRHPLLLTLVARPKNSFTIGLQESDFVKREEELKSASDDFIISHPKTFTKITDEQRSQNTSALLQNILKHNEGICIGEMHHDRSPKKLIIDNLEELKKQGLTTLYLEHLFYDSMQSRLDQYFKSDSQTLNPILEAYLKNLDTGFRVRDNNYDFLALVKAAKKAGIRVVGIDTTVSYYCGVSDKTGVEDDQKRYLAMNSVATAIIEREQKLNPGGKYIALMGSGHVATVNEVNVPGIAELLSVPSIIVEPNEKAGKTSIEFDVKNYRGKVSEVSAVIKLS